MNTEVSHNEIYERLIAVENKVDRIDTNTQDVVKAFEAASGAFLVLEWIAKVAKPLLFIIGVCAALGTWWNHK